MAENKSMVRDLTSGSVARDLLTFAMPLFLANAMQAIYNITDMIVVGQVIGETGMSAVSTGGNVLNIMNFIAMGFSSAGQVIIARHVGSGNLDAVRRTIGTMFSMLLGIAVVLSVICYTLRASLLDLINTPPEAYDETMSYTVICIVGLVFIYGYNIVSAIMRGMGDSKRPFMFVGIAASLNIVLDILFIAFLGMGVGGAALATVIGQGFSFIFAITYLYRHRENFVFDFKLSSFKIDSQSAVRLMTLGIPMSLQSAAVTISMTVVTAWVNSFGVTYSAVAGIISKLNAMIGIMSASLSAASASMIGQNLGARKFDRVPKILIYCGLYTLVISIAGALVLNLWPDLVFRAFTQDVAVVTAAVVIIGPCTLNFFGASTRTMGFGIINGSGNSTLNLLVALLDGLIVRIGAAYILGFVLGLGPIGFWYGDAIAGFMPITIGGIYFLTGKWKK